MSSRDKIQESLLELGNPSARRTRSEQIERAMHVAGLLMGADGVVVLTPGNQSGRRLALHAGSTAAALLPAPLSGSQVVRSFTECCEPYLIPHLLDDPSVAEADGCPGVEAGPAMFSPLRQRDPVLGYIAVYRGRGRAPFTLADARLILLLSAWLCTALESQRLATGMERLAISDDITDVYNSRFLMSALRREIRRSTRFGHELSVVMIDVDRLKAYNETCGELRGSLLLKEIASLLAQQVRSFDLIARHADDAFVLMLPQTGRDGAVEVAERMRAAVEQHSFPFSTAGSVTVSMGVATYPREGADDDALIAAAERALTRAQVRGMNRVETLAA